MTNRNNFFVFAFLSIKYLVKSAVTSNVYYVSERLCIHTVIYRYGADIPFTARPARRDWCAPFSVYGSNASERIGRVAGGGGMVGGGGEGAVVFM